MRASEDWLSRCEDRLGDEARLGPGQLDLAGTVGEEAGERRLEPGLERVHPSARARAERELEGGTVDHRAHEVGVGAGRQLLLDAEAAVEPRGRAAAENLGGELEREDLVAIACGVGRGQPAAPQRGLVHARIRQRDAARGARIGLGRAPAHRRLAARRDRAIGRLARGRGPRRRRHRRRRRGWRSRACRSARNR